MPVFLYFHDLAQLQKSSHGFVQVSMHKCLFLSKKQACLPIILSCNPATELWRFSLRENIIMLNVHCMIPENTVSLVTFHIDKDNESTWREPLESG